MASSAALRQLQQSVRSHHSSNPDNRVIADQINNIKSAIDDILIMVADPSWLPQTLEGSLGIISQFFREQKFATIVLPVLDEISKIDADKWNVAKQWDTQMLLIPKSFENMKASTAEVRGKYGEIHCWLVRERELALLSVYGVTSQILGEIFRILSKNPA